MHVADGTRVLRNAAAERGERRRKPASLNAPATGPGEGRRHARQRLPTFTFAPDGVGVASVGEAAARRRVAPARRRCVGRRQANSTSQATASRASRGARRPRRAPRSARSRQAPAGPDPPRRASATPVVADDDRPLRLVRDERPDESPPDVDAEHVGRGHAVDHRRAQPEAHVDDAFVLRAAGPPGGRAGEHHPRRLRLDHPLEDDGHADVAGTP